jgi:signal peptidase II
VIAVGVIVFILRTSRRIQSLAWAVTLGLLLGGATGNLIDRLFRYPGPFRGYVVDWIQIPHWPVFNVADSCIVCGGVLAVFLAVRGVRIDASAAGRPANQPQAGEPQAGAPPERPAGERGGEPGGQATPGAPGSQEQRGGGGA